MNRKEASRAFGRINYGLFLVAAAEGERYQGCLVNSLHQVTSSDPYQFSVTLNKSSETCRAVLAAGSFSATVLAKEADREVVNRFGYKSGRAVDKFQGLETELDAAGNPYWRAGALARISCRVKQQVEVGGYLLLLCEATETEALAEGAALTVSDFLEPGMATPPAATIYRTLEANTGWRCTVCGYVTDRETLPEGYQCPVCRASRDKFVKL